MDLLTILLGTSALALTVAFMAIRKHNNGKAEAARLVAQAKERAEKRAKERSHADTEPLFTGPHSDLTLDTGFQDTDFDQYNDPGDLSQEQIRTIRAIFEHDAHLGAPIVMEPRGATVFALAGVPVADSVIDPNAVVSDDSEVSVVYIDSSMTIPGSTANAD